MIKFSIVIPTRQRHETLGSTIETVLNQDFDDYEIIVSDNFSSPETKEVVDSFNSQKIKYIRSESALAMLDNWELALSYATGEYVIFFGDDDGLISGCLKVLNDIIVQTNYKLIRWERVYYSWPDMQPEIFANKLHIKYDYGNKIIDSKTLIAQVLEGSVDYTHLPMLYNSVVHFSLIKNHVSSTGRFFHSIVPDLYSGFILSYLSGEFLSLGIPMSINAGSAKSNGASFMFKKREQHINNDFVTLNSLSSISFDDSIPYVRSLFIAVFEPYLKFIKAIQSSEYEFDRLKAFIIIIKNLIVYDEEELNEFTGIIENTANNQGLDVGKIKEELKKIKLTDVNLFESKCGFSDKELVLDASRFGLKTVYDVSNFVKNFYPYENLSKTNFNIISSKGPVYKLPVRIRVKKALKILYKGTV